MSDTADAAWIEYEKECWRKRQQLRRLRDENIKAELLKFGITRFSREDLFELRRCMYDPDLLRCGYSAVFFGDKDGNFVWGKKPERFLTPEEVEEIYLKPLRRISDEIQQSKGHRPSHSKDADQKVS